MLQAALDEFRTAFNALSEALEKYKANLADTKNKNWAKNVESCRKKVKAALEIAETKLTKLVGALNQFETEALKKAKIGAGGVITLSDDDKKKVDGVRFSINMARETLSEAQTIARDF